jgi:hypothetical protein
VGLLLLIDDALSAGAVVESPIELDGGTLMLVHEETG